MTAMPTPHLPPPRPAGPVSLEEALLRRRSRRDFSGAPLSPGDLGQLLWAAHGVTGPDGRRTAPTAGNTSPHELSCRHPRRGLPLRRRRPPSGGDRSRRPARPVRAVARDDDHLLLAGAVIVLAAVGARTADRYPARADRYLALGVGHAAQNILLQAEALGLAAYPVGSHDPEGVARLLRLPEGCVPLYIIPVGHPAAA